MIMRYIFFIILLVVLESCTKIQNRLPSKFVFLSSVDPTIVQNLRYYSNQNFVARQISGYESDKIISTRRAAEQLKKANEFFKKFGYKIVVYDAYRPQTSVNYFKNWSNDLLDDIAKVYYYPNLKKCDLFPLGYISKKSGHSRGSTFDLTLIKTNQQLKSIIYSKRKLLNGEEIPFLDDNTIDMGSSFDLFHEVSHHDSKLISESHNISRNFLRDGMKLYGFIPYQKEWWHYTLKNEPYKDTYFDFILKNK